MEGADKAAGFLFKHWKLVTILVLLIGATLAWRRWSAGLIAKVDLWNFAAKEDLAATKSIAEARERAQAEQAKAEVSARAEDARRFEKEMRERKPNGFLVSERYWVCIRKVVNCVPNPGFVDPRQALKCEPGYSASGSGFGPPRCSGSDMTQAIFVLQMRYGPEKLEVSLQDYSKYEVGSQVFLMCNDKGCDQKIIDPPLGPPASASVAASSQPAL